MDDPNAAQLLRLKKRGDFLAARNGVRSHTRSFTLQSRTRKKNEPKNIPENTARIGFTVTKKVGNAVIRNRIRRRLREVVRLNATSCVQRDHDYVLIAREAALHSPFSALVKDFQKSMGNVSKKSPLNNAGKGH